ncbi:PREDICTED: uncharacterized protein LOC109340930 isoform X2 [Lupinus angustifolius]|uniref:uncharacterized protein LOC109340930 isoform X2 n=1 Tax=Lupinus angustifolius TaxID=3871 RepID=UPI00092FD38B|nr:PREDICTED: uncharacterized protein LOC109340930 isoform X2 [Lupinus angustifolius]
MNEESNSKGIAMDLLQHFEDILESDPLIDELGFIHPSQFDLLNEESGISCNSFDEANCQSTDKILSEQSSKQENVYFWNKDHKLGISTHILLPLYKDAKHSFLTALKRYKTCSNQSNKDGDCLPASSSCDLESLLMRHSRSLLLLSCDFMTAWNSRKLVVSKKKQHSMFLNELILSGLVLSYSPKSEQAWNHRRWVIKSISAISSNLKDILEKESELVEKIAERSKMNYRAWNHRCWLISYMTREQQLMLKIMKDSSCLVETVSFSHMVDIDKAWKDELDWNGTLIKRYVGREALWLYRRFISSCWINHFLTDSGDASHHFKESITNYHDFGTFLKKELCLIDYCSTVVDNEFGDFEAQAMHSASYLLWLKVKVPKPLENELLEKMRVIELKTLVEKSYPERSSLFNYFMS